MSVSDQIVNFRNDCISEPEDIVVQKHLVDGSSYFFENIFQEKDEEFNFKKDLANSLDVHIRDIAIVGSGKLGFSIKPDKDKLEYYPFKTFDFDYNLNDENEKSDLDVAIISSSLFDRQLKEIYEHTGFYTSKEFQGKTKKTFAYYILKGWLNPIAIPEEYKITDEVNLVQEKYINKYKRPVNIGIYKSWYFFENYHRNNINRIKLNHIAN